MKTMVNRLFAVVITSALLLLSAQGAIGGEPDKPADGAKVEATQTNAASEAASMESLSKHHNPLVQALTARPVATGGVDPHGDSWQSIQNSYGQFAHLGFAVRLFCNLLLAVGCAWLIGWHPRASKGLDPITELEERKALLILGVAGAIVAELSNVSPTLAFVIFGIGALLRFRTVLDNPKSTGKAILVVVIGLACGMGSWTMAVFVTAFCWVLLFWIDSRVTCNMSIRVQANGDSKPLQTTVEALLVSRNCRIHSSGLSRSRKRMEFLFQMPAKTDLAQLEADVRSRLPGNGDTRLTIDVM